MKKYFVGAVGRNLTKEESGIGRECKSRKFSTMDEAEDFIGDHLKKINPEGVDRGDYYLDAPEEFY